MMLLPYYVTKRNAHRFLGQISTFDGLVFIPSHQSKTGDSEYPFSDEMRQQIIHRLPRDVESDDHIWIGAERHGTLYSFLHAQAVSGQEAQVDCLCAFKFAYNWQTQAYEGFGEIGALALLCENFKISFLILCKLTRLRE